MEDNMEKLLSYLDASIQKRIEELNEILEPSVEIVEKIVSNDDIFQKLLGIIPTDHRQLLLDYNYNCQLTEIEDVYYRNGFVDGMQLQMQINEAVKVTH
jgi:hypothetical protein